MRYPIICDAIAKGLALNLFYDQKNRTIEPYVYGLTKDGNELLHAWQTSSIPAGWRAFRLDKSLSLSLTQTKVGPVRPDYNRDDPAMDRIFCER